MKILVALTLLIGIGTGTNTFAKEEFRQDKRGLKVLRSLGPWELLVFSVRLNEICDEKESCVEIGKDQIRLYEKVEASEQNWPRFVEQTCDNIQFDAQENPDRKIFARCNLELLKQKLAIFNTLIESDEPKLRSAYYNLLTMTYNYANERYKTNGDWYELQKTIDLFLSRAGLRNR